MLSEAECRALEGIELSLAADDPRFAESLGSQGPSRHLRRARLAHDVVAAIAVLLGVACLALGQLGPGMLTLGFAGLVMGVRQARFAASSQGPRRPHRRGRPGPSTRP
jgi:hypothetical protein